MSFVGGEIEINRPMRQWRAWICAGALLLCCAMNSRAVNAPDYESEVRPVLAKHCLSCHGPKKQRGGFRVDIKSSALAEADSGARPVVPHQPSASELIRRIESDDEDVWMPPKGDRISSAEIQILRRWIMAGAEWPESSEPVAVASRELTVTEEDRQFWSFRPLDKASPPVVDSSWARNGIDSFVLRRLQEAGLTPNPVADSRTLLRRMSFDVLGLPPNEADVRAMERASTTLEAGRRIDELTESLLASDHFGERWARHWLDVARYADSDGYEADRDRPHAYQYRDFVIRAFNEDLPFDTFVQWQLAGDELAPDEPRAITATGFLAAGPVTKGGAPTAPDELKKKARYDELDDMVSTTAQAFLGLTLACARCHDHKFDPIPTRDYYRLVSAFATTERRESQPSRAQRELDIWVKRSKHALLLEKIAKLNCTEDEAKWLAAGPMPPSESKSAFRKYGKRIEFDDNDWRAWLGEEARQKLSRLEASAAQERLDGWAAESALFVSDRSAQAETVRLLRRGDVSLPEEELDLGFLTVLTGKRAPQDYRRAIHGSGLDSTYRRAALAAWMTDHEDGAGALLARVIVNRIWHHYFGRGLVGTPNDFGLQGERPSHPELLDWLAGELIRGEWKLKPIHRLILQSATYRQAATFNAAKAETDPENRLLWRRIPKRLDSEAMRDALLAAGGRLNRSMYGAPIRPFIPTAAMATRSRDKWPENVEEGPEHWRRSIYIFVKRSIRFPMMEAFDAPDPTASCGRRIPTTVPVQALSLLNNRSIRDAAKSFSRRIRNNAADSDDLKSQIQRAFRSALGRSPSMEEVANSVAFLKAGDGPDPLADLCHALFTLNEFVYVN